MNKEHPLFLLTSVESDAHTWNLVYMQCLLEGVQTVVGAIVRIQSRIRSVGALAHFLKRNCVLHGTSA
jgi:hypothetical protein